MGVIVFKHVSIKRNAGGRRAVSARIGQFYSLNAEQTLSAFDLLILSFMSPGTGSLRTGKKTEISWVLKSVQFMQILGRFLHRLKMADPKDDNEVRVIVGLGNPGLEYARTRHNMGFMIVDAIGTRHGAEPTTNSRLKCDFAKFSYRGKTIMLVKPMTYMNLSGQSFVAVKQWFKLPISSFIVVHDDVALPLGKLRVQNGGGAGGQHGVESIIECLVGDTTIVRLKFGVGPDPGGDRRAGYVLAKVPEAEQELLAQCLVNAEKCIFTWINEGALAAANKFNSIDLRPEAIAEAEEKKRQREKAAQERKERFEKEKAEKKKAEQGGNQSENAEGNHDDDNNVT